jgi:hypothetical protein
MLLVVGGGISAIVLDQIYVQAWSSSLEAVIVEGHDLLVDCVILVVRDASDNLSKAHEESIDSLWVVVGWVHWVVRQLINQSREQGVVELLGEDKWGNFWSDSPQHPGLGYGQGLLQSVRRYSTEVHDLLFHFQFWSLVKEEFDRLNQVLHFFLVDVAVLVLHQDMQLL